MNILTHYLLSFDFIYICELVFVLYTGLVLGSFATALSYRVPLGLPWAGSFKKDQQKQVARSACPECKTQLRFFDLVPVFSWLFLKGRCRYCEVKIPGRYPLVELVTMLACLGVFLVYGVSAESVMVIFMVPFLMALFVIDVDHMILPNQLVAILGGLAVSILVAEGIRIGWGYNFMIVFWDKLFGLCVFSGLVYFLGLAMKMLLKKETLGFGDVKFFAVAGFLLGLGQLSTFFILSGFFGVFLGTCWRIVKKQQLFPFGPALIAALYINLLLKEFGFNILNYYT